MKQQKAPPKWGLSLPLNIKSPLIIKTQADREAARELFEKQQRHLEQDRNR